MIRNKCILCDNTIFTNVFDLISTINMTTTTRYNESELFNLKFIGCKNCGCTQLEKLYDPNEIYEEPLQCIDGPLLTKHHDLFAQFVFDRVNNYEELFEIGGSYGKIATRIINKYKEIQKLVNYKILEFNIDNYPPVESIEYISGNCETFDYSNAKIIIMSHVFEHLYEPKKFIEKINNENVEEVFISIPDMENLMSNGDVNNLNIFHTFYLDTPYLEYLFSLFDYKLESLFNYSNSSTFYHFKKQKNDSNDIKKDIIQINMRRPELIETISLFYENIKSKIRKINVSNNFFICPAGFYGRFIYNYLNEETKKNVSGFLDSDKFKINRRLSGTPFLVYDKNYISKFENISILICSEKHKNELTNELLTYNKNIEFIYL